MSHLPASPPVQKPRSSLFFPKMGLPSSPDGREPAPGGHQTLDELTEEGKRLYPPQLDELFLDEDGARAKISVNILLGGRFVSLNRLPHSSTTSLLKPHENLKPPSSLPLCRVTVNL